MARPIDKRIMLDLIIEAKKTDPEAGPFSEWLAEYLVDHLPTLTPPNEWVSVENALPPNMDDVLVVVQNNGERWTVTGYYSNTSNVWYAMLNGQDTQMDVLWWMRFPAPPDRRPPERQEDT